MKLAGNGFSIEGAVRGLVAHEESGYEEWGASGTIRIDPSTSGRRLSFTLRPTWGVASSGVDQLWGLENPQGIARDRDFEPEGRLEAELGYSIGVPRTRGVVTPYTGISLGEDGHHTRIGARWNIAPKANLGLEGTNESGQGKNRASQAIMFRTSLSW